MNAFQDFIQFYGSNSDREVTKIVAWEIINPRILNDDSQETWEKEMQPGLPETILLYSIS